ncbi:MAG: DUF4214 domain-containing protein [Lachnospiraceae bacterium]|nr:DUF4214 domain-containing protein [Lachnospiraceae bacterium]
MKRSGMGLVGSMLALSLVLGLSLGAENVSAEPVTEGQVSQNTAVDTVKKDEAKVDDIEIDDAELEETMTEVYEEGELEEEASTIEAFVTRLYSVCLDREPDAAGLQDWSTKLRNKTQTGSQVAYGFIFSGEFQNKNYCNDCYIKKLYAAFMGREPDANGFASWQKAMENGMTREEVFNGFVMSTEFKNICKDAGISVGVGCTLPQYGTVAHGSCSKCGATDGVTAFVTRLYSVCLDREPDASGLAYWSNLLWSHEKSGSEVAAGFVFSAEFSNKGLANMDFVQHLYAAMFDRSADATGMATWLNKMSVGVNRSHVFSGFANSQEFTNLCNKYGITRGTYVPIDDQLTVEYVKNMSTAQKWYLISEERGMNLYDISVSQADCIAMQKEITVPVWDFKDTKSMTKVGKMVTLTVNRHLADYITLMFHEIYHSADQPVIQANKCVGYEYRVDTRNSKILSTHAFGASFDLSTGVNVAKNEVVTKTKWDKMATKTILEKQKKAYTIYEGCTIQRICAKYGFGWGGYSGDPMHFGFVN